MKAKKKKNPKPKEQQSYPFSAESVERYDKWLEESGKRWSKMEDSPEKVLVIPQLNARLEKINSEIPKLADKAVEKAISDMEKASKKIELN